MHLLSLNLNCTCVCMCVCACVCVCVCVCVSVLFTSIWFDSLNILLGICNLDGASRNQFLTPAPDVMVKIYDTEVIIYGHVNQASSPLKTNSTVRRER